MKHKACATLESFRRVHPVLGPTIEGSLMGFFQAKYPKHDKVINIISSGRSENWNAMTEWEHVSVSLPHRCPTWDEMVFVKDLFWNEDETVIQFHPKKSEYVNNMPYCLHLWKPLKELELPPSLCVGLK